MSALDLLFTATWKGSLLVAFVLLFTYALRGHMPARWVHTLVVVALVRMVLPFAPSSPLSVFNLAPRQEPVFIAAGTAAPAPAAIQFKRRAPAPLPLQHRAPWQTALLALWICGVIVAAVRIVIQSLMLRRIVADSEPLQRSALLDECREAMNVRRRVTVAVSRQVDAPALYGVFRPTLLLPTHSFSDEQLRFVYLHELAHLRRFDVLVNWIAAVVHALHWFNPLVRIAVSRLAEERELACDALALEHLALSERAAYGGTLLRMLDQWRLPPPVPGLVGMSTTHDQVKRRIRMIATFRKESRRAVWMTLVLTISVVSLTDATAGEQPRMRMMKHLSPAADATMHRLDEPVQLALEGVTVEQLVNAVSAASGVTIAIAPDAIDQAVRETTFDIKAEKIPAHVVLVESLNAVSLGLDFDEAGNAQITKLPPGAKMRVAIQAPEGAQIERNVVIVNGDAASDEPVAVQAGDAAGDGAVRQRVTVRGSEGGQAEGTFSLEVHRHAASTQR